MPTTITTVVYTYDELSETAQEKARDWYRNSVLTDFYVDDMSETLSEALHQAYGPDAAVTEWDSYRNYVQIRGTLRRPREGSPLGEGFQGWKVEEPHGGMIDLEVMAEWPDPEADTLYVSNNYGRWVPSTGYPDDESVLDLTDAYVREVEGVLLSLMKAEDRYLCSDEYAEESIQANEYTFTETGRRFG